MTIALTYDDTLSRVQIALSALADGTVRVERSLTADFALFSTVRGGVELPVSGGVANLDDFEFAADATSHYRVLDTDDDSLLESDSITPDLDGRVWLKSINYPLLNQIVRVAEYGDVSMSSRNGIFPIGGKSLPTGTSDLLGGRDHALVITTQTDAESAKLELSLRAGGTWFIHVPTDPPLVRDGNRLLPGSMHVLINTPNVRRLGGVSDYQHYVLPLVEVDPPGPDVVGTTLTWSTVMRLYGSWTAVWAAHATWRSLWSTIGAPSDPVVL